MLDGEKCDFFLFLVLPSIVSLEYALCTTQWCFDDALKI